MEAKQRVLAFFVLAVTLLTGCSLGGDDGDSTGPVVPTEYVTLSGTLTAPEQIESSLIANLLQNTDSQVRDAFDDSAVFVNGARNSNFTLNPLSSTPNWSFRLPNVAKSSNDKYRVEVTVGKINLKSLVTSANKDNFKINTQTTASLMLADATGMSVENLLASYPSFVTDVEASLIDASKQNSEIINSSIVKIASVTEEINNQKSFITDLQGIETTAKVAYLESENDLDGDGIIDVKVEPNTYGTRVRFYTALSSATSFLEGIETIQGYTDDRLLQDFDQGLTSATRFFSPQSADFALGLYFKKSAAADEYLKLFVRRIDLDEGELQGVVAEYEIVKTETTAIATGTKTFMLVGETPVEGAVVASNFITDTEETGPYVMSFLSAADGLGNNETPMVKYLQGKPELKDITAAETYLAGGGNYYYNTTEALKASYNDRTIEVDDVFYAYFPSSKNYALFKIQWIDTDRVTVDYVVNSAENEPRFN
ncbi:MAG: hypothetical protein ACQETH_08465 [Candidatus Rifleibacteriota bacterium]